MWDRDCKGLFFDFVLFLLFSSLFPGITDLSHCRSLGVQHDTLTYIWCEVITTVSLVSLHQLIQIQ